MKHKNLIILIFIAFITLSFSQTSYRIKYIYDGDTVMLHTGKRLRYLGIDAPELDYEGGNNEFLAVASRRFNQKLVGRQVVRIEFDKQRNDHHNRMLAYVFLNNGKMVNVMMLRKGLAHVMIQRPNTKYFAHLLENQRLAISDGIGIWQRDSKKRETSYLGNRRSLRFHRPHCPFARKIHPDNRITFKKSRDAYWSGFSPCRRCEP